MEPITPNLWFATQAEEAANFYVSIFPDSRISKISRYGKEGFEIHKMPEGTVMTIEFFLNGQQFTALNGGPVFKFNEAVSFVIHCKDQPEVDHYWNKLSEGGDPNSQQCGWLKDKFGLSWQVIPDILPKLFSDPDPAVSKKAMNAMLKMKKIIIKELTS
jgi:predicted 3-demethylubiquinone-9 3-methyltransferase (glyoxalase superfamily)